MFRSVALAAGLAVLIAAGGAYAVSQSAWRNFTTAWLGGPGGEATLATPWWCTSASLPSLGSVEGLDPDFAPAMQYYQQALTLNRRHRGAHEHLGELYLTLGEPTKAEEHLGALEDICLIPCQEFDDLRREIAGYRGFTTH